MIATNGETVKVDILGSLRKLFFDLAARAVVLMVVILLIAVAPLISLGFPVLAMLDAWSPSRTGNLIGFFAGSASRSDGPDISLGLLGYGFGWLAFICPICVGVYYMFVASITRCSRERLEGLNERCPLVWAPLRFLGGTIWSYTVILCPTCLLALYGEKHQEGSPFFSNMLTVANENASGGRSPVPLLYAIFFVALVLVWSPVIVNLTRHFKRYWNVPPERGYRFLRRVKLYFTNRNEWLRTLPEPEKSKLSRSFGAIR